MRNLSQQDSSTGISTPASCEKSITTGCIANDGHALVYVQRIKSAISRSQIDLRISYQEYDDYPSTTERTQVVYEGQECFIFGRRSSGYFDLRKLDGTKVHASAGVSKLKKVEHASTLFIERRRASDSSPTYATA